MEYIKVAWNHSIPDEPVLLYSELDHECRELRKLEVFADGKMTFASIEKASGTTRLSSEALPTLAAIGVDPQFQPVEITKAEFETVWHQAIG